MRPADAEVIEQRDHVPRHVDQRVRHLAATAQQIAPDPSVHRARGAHPVHLGRQPGVAMVEADHAVPRVDELRAEAVRPHRQLGAQPHDQQDRRIVRVAEVFVIQLDGTVGSLSRRARPLRVCTWLLRLPRLDPAVDRPPSRPASSSYMVAPSMLSRMMSAWPACRVSSLITCRITHRTDQASDALREPRDILWDRHFRVQVGGFDQPQRLGVLGLERAQQPVQRLVGPHHVLVGEILGDLVERAGIGRRGVRCGGDPRHPVALQLGGVLDQPADRQRADRRRRRGPARRSGRRPPRKTRSGDRRGTRAGRCVRRRRAKREQASASFRLRVSSLTPLSPTGGRRVRECG